MFIPVKIICKIQTTEKNLMQLLTCDQLNKVAYYAEDLFDEKLLMLHDTRDIAVVTFIPIRVEKGGG